jgi:hypothetical protein
VDLLQAFEPGTVWGVRLTGKIIVEKQIFQPNLEEIPYLKLSRIV